MGTLGGKHLCVPTRETRAASGADRIRWGRLLQVMLIVYCATLAYVGYRAGHEFSLMNEATTVLDAVKHGFRSVGWYIVLMLGAFNPSVRVLK
jgi:hypothetical protein